ncbi:tRNA (5-methylaminomethyl-2-thiouridine)(34)-methyltransferase MnmD [Flavobacteriales bacterium]|nr:tRNA (5-methylaminomethyl-2-thiouridine)(34)-methyltransferase MnmD [Flavobacteriales bacterium]
MNKSSVQSSLQIVTTNDGSQTLLNEALGSTYHSRHGALTESQHVFIDKGLRKQIEKGLTNITLLEMGFGTGLNALLTGLLCEVEEIKIDYHGLELFPISEDVWQSYQLPAKLEAERNLFESIHNLEWNRLNSLLERFMLTKHHVSLFEFLPEIMFDLVYYDAFEPETQPELWTTEVFAKLWSWMNEGGVLTTYCCKGYVRRNMISAGFDVEKVPGPPGKREMICAVKPLSNIST